MSETSSEFLTRREFETRMNYHEKILDERTIAIQAMMEKNLAEMKAVISDIRADFSNFRSEVKTEISDIKGDVKALNAKVDAIQMKFGWYLVLFGVAVSIALFLAQKFLN